MGDDGAVKAARAQPTGGQHLGVHIVQRQHHGAQAAQVKVPPQRAVGGIGEFHPPPLGPVALHLEWVGIERKRRQPAFQEPVIGRAAGAPHAQHQHISAAQRAGLFVRVDGAALPAGQPPLEPVEYRPRRAVQGGGDDKGQRHGQGKCYQMIRHQRRGDDQAEFAIGRQAERSQKRAARAQAEQDQKTKEQRTFGPQQRRGGQREQQVAAVGQPAQADFQEKADEEDLFQRPQRL